MAFIQENLSLILLVILSLVIISVFMYIREKRPALLDLETRWIAVASIPVLVGLFSGGYIYKFKGFGIELESAINKFDMKDIALKAKEVATVSQGESKGTITKLESLSKDYKSSIQRLSFKLGGTYYADAVDIYIRELPNLKFIEIIDKSNNFIGLMSVKRLDNISTIRKFLSSIRNETFKKDFLGKYVDKSVTSNTNAIEALSIMRNNHYSYLPVVEGGELKGIISEVELMRKLSDKIIEAKEKS